MEGKCLCGKVTVSTGDITEFDACHCGMCRRWGGGPFMAAHRGQEITIEGEDYVQTFPSSEWAERAFCKHCGTHLYYHLLPTDEFMVSLGLFQERDDYAFQAQIFVDQKPAYYAFANKTRQLTEQQVFEQYGAG